MMNKSEAIAWLFPDKKPPFDFCVGDVDGEHKIVAWNIDAPIPTEKELQVAWEAYQVHTQSIAYRVKRAEEYPSIGDQLDAIFKAGLMPKDMAAQIQAVKDKYPKGSV